MVTNHFPPCAKISVHRNSQLEIVQIPALMMCLLSARLGTGISQCGLIYHLHTGYFIHHRVIVDAQGGTMSLFCSHISKANSVGLARVS